MPNHGHVQSRAGVMAAWLALALLVGLGMVSSAEAQRRRRPKVIQLEEIHIEGRVQKPNAFYILNRSNLGYEVMRLQTTFVDQVVKAVERKPF